MQRIKNIFRLDRNKRAHFFGNVIVGVVIAIIFSLTTSSQWGAELMNVAFDLLVRYESIVSSNSVNGVNQLFFVEITPSEYRQLGEPLLTPRDRVADLIETAWKKGAQVVALDILLDRTDQQNPLGDKKLRRLLEKMLRENAKTQIIFPVRIGADGELRHHIFDDLLDKQTTDGRHIFYPAVPTALASEGDLLNRFWGSYQVGRDQSGHTKVIWSVPLLAAALHAGSQTALEKAAKELLSDSEHRSDITHGEHPYIEFSGNRINLSPLQRKNLPGIDLPTFVEGESHSLPYSQRIRFLIPPETKTRRDSNNFRSDLSPDSLYGKIVIIGNGSPETGDIISTPVGRMPGMYFIGNAINTIVTGKMPLHMNIWLHITMELLIIIAAAFVFVQIHDLLAQLLSSLAFIIILVPVSWFFYRNYGVFFNFIIPVVGMRLHHFADRFESMVAMRGRKHHDHNQAQH